MRSLRTVARTVTWSLLPAAILLVAGLATVGRRFTSRQSLDWPSTATAVFDTLAAKEAELLGLGGADADTLVFAKLLAQDVAPAGRISALPEALALDAILRSDVVIFADIHSNPDIAVGAARILERVASRYSDGQSPLTILFELLPPDSEPQVSAARVALRRGDDVPLKRLLGRHIPYPISGYLEFLKSSLRLGSRVRCMERSESRVLLPEDIPDSDRTIFHPRAVWVGPTQVRPMHERIAETNRDFTQELERIVTRHHGSTPRAWAIIGCAHLFGGEGLVPLLRQAGVRVAVVALQSDQIDAKALRTGKTDWLDSWLELSPGVFRAPTLGGFSARSRRLELMISLDRWVPRWGR